MRLANTWHLGPAVRKVLVEKMTMSFPEPEPIIPFPPRSPPRPLKPSSPKIQRNRGFSWYCKTWSLKRG
jgi:hypothetical protein